MDTIQSLDAVVTEMAVALHTSSPLPDWRQVTLFAKYAPYVSTAVHDYDYLLADGSLNQSVSPEGSA
jgi:hypothetical protein